ncbi:hypothetical protein PL9631_900078 [Planktothrix paucivesiculata PCC 9631]|uniref:Uncharacterized protein n=1 Tax=Planktothrix paucivesiculata PCC 9631 TaxID=671071 RepID=A0A7Z9C3M8_9CYAN|nr:hypothetical protein PL9631_900078 [Planktothrix paucivesiculata PCC 9631]
MAIDPWLLTSLSNIDNPPNRIWGIIGLTGRSDNAIDISENPQTPSIATF